jgi:hypothetical protein
VLGGPTFIQDEEAASGIAVAVEGMSPVEHARGRERAYNPLQRMGILVARQFGGPWLGGERDGSTFTKTDSMPCHRATPPPPAYSL